MSVTLAGGPGGVSNADTVDGLHAAPSPQPGKLLALDSLSRFPLSVIDWSSVAGEGMSVAGTTLRVSWGATPTTIQPDDSASGGSAVTVARSDHRHAIAAATPGSISPNDAAAEGTATTFARSDHRHAITAAAPTTNLSVTSANAEGSATSFARSDHSHALTAYSDASVYPGHLLKGDASGDLKVRRLEASDRLIASLVTSAAGTGLTLQPDGDLVLDPDSNLAKVSSGVRLQSDGYVSQTTGWGIAFNGAADFRYLYVDEMHAKAFVADLEQALAGGQIIAKSVAPLQSDFTVPAPGATADLWVESFAGFPAAQVFQNGDTVMVRTFSRTGTSLTIGNAFGTVSGAFIVTGEGRQRWTFTRLSGTVNGHPRGGYMAAGTVVPRGTLALDFGVSGNGYYEVNAIDGAMGANSPYAQIVTWNAHPWYDRTVRTRYGNLYGVFASAGEYGMFAGEGAAASDQFLRLSNQAIEGHNLPIRLYDGATQVVRLEPGTYPYLGIGSPAPTSYLGATGIWMGKHSSAYKAHVGTVSGGDVTAGWKWDGSTLTVKGSIYVTGGDAAKTDLSNVAANTVTGKVNADSTLIQPGRIVISGSTTLDDWRYGNSTMIDGGDIYAGSVTADKFNAHGANRVANAGFELGTSAEWTTGTGSPTALATTSVHSGAYALRVTGNGADNIAAAWQVYLVEPGANYYAGVWTRLYAGVTGATGLYIVWLDAADTTISTTTAYSAASETYALKSVIAVAPSNAYKARLVLTVRSDVTGNALFDDVEFYRADGAVLVGTPAGARVEINTSGIEGYSDASTKQFYLRTSDGRGMFGEGKGILDASGIILSGSETSYNTYNAMRWLDGTLPSGDEVARVSAGLFARDDGNTADVPALRIVSDPAGAYGASELELSNHGLTNTPRQRLLFFNATAADVEGIYHSGIKLEVINTPPSSEANALLYITCGPGDFSAPAKMAFVTNNVLRFRVDATDTRINTGLVCDQGTTLQISNGAITVTHVHHVVDGEGGAADDLVTINSYGVLPGRILILHSATFQRPITLKDGTGNLRLAGDFILGDTTDSIMLMYWNSLWNEISRSNN